MKSLSVLSLSAITILSANPALAANLEIYVAPKGSAAYETAQVKAEAENTSAQRKIHKAFMEASAHLQSCGSCSVTIKISHGNYVGKAKVGQWVFPDTVAPNADLKILGGYDDTFETRQPFSEPTILQVNENRANSVIKFEGKKHALKSLVISGLTIDTTPSNRYDSQTNSLRKGSSSSFPQISVGYLTTSKLVIADNVFMSAPNSVGGPLIRAASDTSDIIVENNIFFNNVYTWGVSSGASNKMPRNYVVRGNSFILNWPYNPDQTTSNPGTLEIGNNYAAQHVIIDKNLFAYNYGGAIHPQWDDTRGPKISITDNLFFGNGALFSDGDTDTGVVVGKFAGSATHSIFTAEDLEDDFSWTVSGNVSFDPELEIQVPETKSIQGVGQRSEDKTDDVTEDSEDAQADESVEELGEVSDGLAELESLVDGLDMEDADVASEETDEDVSDPMDDIDLDFSFESPSEDDPGSSNIGSYAPKMTYVPGNLPFPNNSEAKAYGASPERVGKY